MFNIATRQGLFVLMIMAGPLFAQVTDTLYTQQITPRDLLRDKIVPVFDKVTPNGANLVGWQMPNIPIDSTADVDPDAIPTIYIDPSEVRRVIDHFPNMLRNRLATIKRIVEVDPIMGSISFYREHDGVDLMLPSTASITWYAAHHLEARLRVQVREKLSKSLQSDDVLAAARGRAKELFGADIGGQRVSLQVAGNVTVKGGVKFHDREKLATSFKQSKGWDLEVDQTQRFDITGSVGDRIDVLIHQDSENDFEFENDMKLAYKGDEDEILQKIDAGNISLSLPGTKFATGSGGNSKGLFGIKALSKLGPINITTIASIERSQKSIKSNSFDGGLVLQDRNYLRNKYFFIDSTFRANYFPLDSVDGIHRFNPNRVMKQLEVYSSSSRIFDISDVYNGTAFIDPNNTTAYPDSVEGQFRRLELHVDYVPNYQLGTIRLSSSAQDDEIIAVAYSLGFDTGAPFDSVGTVGYLKSDNSNRLKLKLTKDRGQSVSSPTSTLEFKHVYSLGGIGINSEGFEVNIFDVKAPAGRTDRSGDQTFLNIFGLDFKNNGTQSGNPDNIIDLFNTNLVKLNIGELHFPTLLPFAHSEEAWLTSTDPVLKPIYKLEYGEFEDLNGNFVFDSDEDLNGDGKWNVPDHYYAPLRQTAARFEIEIKQSSAGASVYNLGFNMVPGSESVIIDGQPLTVGVDYEIDSFSNTLTILRMEDYANPEVTIEYEVNSLVSFDKKVMMGSRLQWDFGKQSFLGLTGLYYNQSIIDERVEVGSEPIRNMLWDVNGRIGTELPSLTRLIDRLPLIQTDAASSFNFEGEFAQVLPNPNPLGAGYLDDFEASKRVTSPSLQYRQWKRSAPPVGKKFHHGRKMAWWNPFIDISVQEIWPEREVSATANNLTTTTMFLTTYFTRYGEAPSDSMWAGVTYPLYASDYDQSQTKFLEIWLNGNKGKLHIDIGDISEDINGNRKIDSEDRLIPGTSEGNGLLEIEEDIGIDGCTDLNEDGTGGCFFIDDDGDGRIDEEIFNGLDDDGDGRIDEDLVARPALADTTDPNGDNWSNSASNVRNDFVNGTEGNSKSSDGARPDTEDLNGTGSFAPDVKNDYFTLGFELDPSDIDFDPTLVGGSTFRDNNVPTGWRLFRLPLSDFVPEGSKNVSWDNVKNMRIWIDGLEGTSTSDNVRTSQVQIAQIEFVGNEWVELGLANLASNQFTQVDTANNLLVAVVNTEDNPDYTSPPNVQGSFDQLHGIRLKEQSLALDFRKRGLPPGTKGGIQKEVTNRSNDATFFSYRTMEMYIYGESQDLGAPLMTSDSTYYLFWLRLGLDESSYYEIRKPLYADWDDKNHLRVDMEELATLKLLDPDTLIIVDADTLAGYFLDDMEVYIRGEPSIERTLLYTAGVINTHPTRTIYGRAYMDEFRLTDVKKEKGIAVRMSGKLTLADLITTSFSYSRQDADFHKLQQKSSRNSATKESFSSSLLINPDRLLPKAWGIKMPVSLNYKKAVTSPKYLPGRDILAGDIRSAPEEVQTRSESMTMKVSFGKSVRSRYWVLRQTLDRLTGGVSYSFSGNSNKDIQQRDNRRTVANLSYPIKFSDENFIKPFMAIQKIPWLGRRLKDTRFYYTPTSLQFGGNVSETITEQINRARTDSTIEIYGASMNRSMKAVYKVTDKLNFDYSRNAASSLDDLRFSKLEALQTFNTGRDQKIGEQYSAKFNPEIFSWLKPNFSYQARYDWNKNRPIADPLSGARIGVNSTITTSLKLTPKEIIEVFYKPEKKSSARSSRPSRRRTRTPTPTPTEEEPKAKKVQNKQLKAIFKLLHAGSSKISPISVIFTNSATTNEPAVRGIPDFSYRSGFKERSGLIADTAKIGSGDLTNITGRQDFTWSSGLALTKSVNINFKMLTRRGTTKNKSSETKNETQSFLVLSDKGDKIGFPMVDWGVRLSGLEKLPIMNKLKWTVNFEHNYTGSHVRNKTFGQSPINTYTRNFSPLAGMTITFRNGISSNFRFTDQLSLKVNDAGFSKDENRQFSSSISYQHRGGFTIPLPFFENKHFNNTINFSLAMEASSSKSSSLLGDAEKYEETGLGRRSTMSIKPYITYTFSKKVNGSFRFGYSERESPTTGKTITRDIGFDVNMSIRGS